MWLLQQWLDRLGKFGLVYVAGVALLTLIFGTIYATVQHDLRLSANQAAAQLAEDTAVALDQGDTGALAQQQSVNFATSLAPFTIVYDSQGRPVMASGRLEGEMPLLPGGVLDYVRGHGEDRFTWQPRVDVRIAAVVTQYRSGFVLGGRNLRETERIESDVELMAGGAWLLSLLILTGAVGARWWLTRQPAGR